MADFQLASWTGFLAEVKGTDIRKSVKSTSRRDADKPLASSTRWWAILGYYDVKIIGRVWVKTIGRAIDGWAIYILSIQRFARVSNTF